MSRIRWGFLTAAVVLGLLAGNAIAAPPPPANAARPPKTTTTRAATTTTVAATTTTVAPTTTTTGGSGTVTAPCLNVAYVDSAAPASNFGSAPDMAVAGTSKLPLLACDVTGIPAGASVTSATLAVFSRSVNTAHTVRLHHQPTAWTEGTVTWNSLHTYDPAILSSAPGDLVAGAGEWVNLAAPTVTGNGVAQFTLDSSTAGTQLYASDDYTTDITRRPKLTVDYSTGATTTSTTGTTLPTTTSTTIGTGVPQPLGPGGAWTVTFEDTFEGTSLNTTKWNPEDGWTGQNNVTTLASNVAVSGGQLILTLSSSTEGAGLITDLSGTANDYGLPVGGFTEARVWFPGDATDGVYNWPAWWTSGDNWPAAGEHDIAEGLSGNLTVNYHSPSGSHNQGAPPGTWYNAWHTYGLHRKATSADVYWDGVLVKTYGTDDNGGIQYLRLNVGRRSSGPVTTGTASEVKVDYARAWVPA